MSLTDRSLMSKLEDDPPVPVDGCAYSAYTTSTMYGPGQGSAQLLCGYHNITTLAITDSENERRIGIGCFKVTCVVVLNTWSSITHTPYLCLPSRLGSIFLSIHRSRHHRASQGIPFSPIDCSKLPTFCEKQHLSSGLKPCLPQSTKM